MRFVVVAFLLLSSAWLIAQEQPVPYSHKKHLAMGLKCANCHENPDPGEVMGLPPVKKCMTCHVAVKTDSPHIQKLAAWAKQDREPPWMRVYQLPAFVFFSHRTHTETGATCQTCHGPVQEREVIKKETDISMGGCMDCHRKNKASLDCGFCHEPRN